MSYVEKWDGLGYYTDAHTLVIRIGTFYPQNPLKFQTKLVKWITQNIGRTKSKQLVFDLQGNAGGYLLLVIGFLKFLFGGHPLHEILFDVVQNPIFDELFRVGEEAQKHRARGYGYGCAHSFFYPCSFVDPHTGEVFSDLSWYTTGPTKVQRGSGKVNLSKLFRMNGNGSLMYESWQSLSDVRAAASQYSEVILVSHGFCGSVCAVFAAYIQLFGLGTTVVFGGTKTDNQMSFWSFPGGITLTLNQFSAQANADLFWYNKSVAEHVPSHLPLFADQHMAVGEVYISKGTPNQRDLPLEFQFHPAHHTFSWELSLLMDMQKTKEVGGDPELTLVSWVLDKQFSRNRRVNAHVLAADFGEMMQHMSTALVATCSLLIVIAFVVSYVVPSCKSRRAMEAGSPPVDDLEMENFGGKGYGTLGENQ